MKLNLDVGVIGACDAFAQVIAHDVGGLVAGKTTLSVERATARLLGIDGEIDGVPAPNALVDQLPPDVLARGIARHPQVDCVPSRKLVLLRQRLEQRKELRASLGDTNAETPLRYVLTATGDVEEDVTHALAVAGAGGDIIAVIRSTAQSLLDYVPHGATHEGYGGTYATQENFRIMRQALDEWSEHHGRYVRLSSFCSGLCMPEIAVIGALEGLDNMVNDAMYGVLYRDINMVRTLVDQRFSRLVNGWAGITINTGEDNYGRTADAIHAAPAVVASQFINLHLARASGVPDEQIGLGCAFEVDPDTTNSLLYEIAYAQLTRDLFPACPVKYMPPTRHMTGDVWRTHATDTLFNVVATLTRQGIHTIGVPTEGIFTPHIHDRVIALQNASYTRLAAQDLADEIQWRPGGLIERHAQHVLRDAYALLERGARHGLPALIEAGVFGGVKRSRDGGRGADGIVEKAADYHNPCEGLMLMGLV